MKNMHQKCRKERPARQCNGKKSPPWLENGAEMAAAFVSQAILATCFGINQRFIAQRTLNTTSSTKYYSLDMKRIDLRLGAILTTRRTQYKIYVFTTTKKRGTCAQSKRIVHMHHPSRWAPSRALSTRWGTRWYPSSVQSRLDRGERDRHCRNVAKNAAGAVHFFLLYRSWQINPWKFFRVQVSTTPR